MVGDLVEPSNMEKIKSLEELITAYRERLWKYDRLDREVKNSNLPEKLLAWIKEKIRNTLKGVNSLWMEFYDPREHEKTDQAGLIKRILEQDGKQAVIVADAFRYELAASMERKGIKKEMNSVIAMTPTITPIGMGALFSSGNVRKEHDGKNFFVVDEETGKRISNVDSREENIKRMIDGVKIYPLSKKIPPKLPEKVIFMSREVDEAGHGELIDFISNIVEKISETVKTLVNKGYMVHLVSDHGFCLLSEEDATFERKSDSFFSSGRYKLLNKAPSDLKYEKIGNDFVAYANCGKSFEKNGEFFHGGVSVEEVLIPHVVFKKEKEMKKKVRVSIYKKEELKILRKKRIEVSLIAAQGLFESEPRSVYVEVKKKRFDLKKPIIEGEIIKVPISFEASEKEKFEIALYDAEDGTKQDSVKVEYLPLREEFF
jgi:hypothetical protein